MSFKEFLQDELAKPSQNYYNPEGNSSRAIVTRGRFKETIYHYKKLHEDIISTFSVFDGFNTPIGWFLLIPVYILLLPIIPLLQGLYSYHRAINEYRAEYIDKLHR